MDKEEEEEEETQTVSFEIRQVCEWECYFIVSLGLIYPDCSSDRLGLV